jgi:hypothetical protein
MLRKSMIVAMVILVATISRAGAASTEGGSQKPGKGGGNKGSGQVMKKLDTDKDGQVSKSEFEAAKSKGSARGKGKAGAGHGRAFAKIDTNGDGSLSATELKSRQDRKNQRPGGGKL